jgi:hypothetical protein
MRIPQREFTGATNLNQKIGRVKFIEDKTALIYSNSSRP